MSPSGLAYSPSRRPSLRSGQAFSARPNWNPGPSSSQQLRLLDKVVRYRFGDNAELMGAWESARNASLRSARRVAGSFQTKNEPESGAGGSETPKAA